MLVWLSFSDSHSAGKLTVLLRGSWDLVTRVIIKVTVLRTTYNPT